MTVKGPGVSGLRPARYPGHGARLRHVESWRVPSARLHGGLRGAGHTGEDRPAGHRGQAGLVKAFQDATAAVDSSGLCVFTTFAWTLDNIAPQVDAACEGDWSPERLVEVGERIWNLERDFNMKAGLTGKDDNLPKRFYKEAANVGPAKGLTTGLDEMLPEYYQLRGWAPDGTLTTQTRQRFGLPG